MDLLLTEADNVVGACLKQSLERHGLSVCTAADRTKGGQADFLVPPSKDERNFVRGVQKALEESGARFILPVFYPEYLAKYRDEFPAGSIIADSYESIVRLDNKASCCNLAASLGIPQPRIYSSPEDIDSYPVVFKRTSGHGGDSVYFPANPKSLGNLISNATRDAYLITEDIEGGEEVSVDALRWDGFFFAACYKVLEPVGRKGISTKRIGIHCPQLTSYAQMLLDAIGYRGVAGLDFLVKDGRTYFLECNPRFSGGLPSSIAGGFDIPWLLWQAVNGLGIGQPSFTPGIITGIDI